MKKIAISLAVVALLSGCGGGDNCESSSGLAFGALLSGCGDGDSDSSSTVVPDSSLPGSSVSSDSGPPVVLSATNFDVAGKEVIKFSFDADVGLEVSDFLSGAEISNLVSFPYFVQPRFVSVDRLTKRAVYLSGVSLTDTEACPGGGSVTISGNLNNEDNATPGDVVVMSYNNCQEGNSTLNGSASIRYLAVSGQADRYPNAVSAEVSIADFRRTSGSSVVQTSGSLTIQLSQTSANIFDLTFTIPSMVTTASAGGKSETHRYANFQTETSVRGSTTSLTMNGGMYVPTLGGTLVTVKTLQPFVSTTGYPISGTVTATTAAGGSMRMSAVAASKALIEFDAANDGVYEVSKSVSWSEIF